MKIGRPIAIVQGGKALADDARGATIVEFALVAPLFMFMLLATFVASFTYFTQEALETAAAETMRTIMVGDMRSTSMAREKFAGDVCARLPSFMPCTQVRIDLRASATPMKASGDNGPDHAGDQLPEKLEYDTGGPGDIITLRLYYQRPAINGPLDALPGTARMRGGPIVATQIAKVEAFAK